MARKPAPKSRQAETVQRLRDAGGRRISLNLPFDVAQAIDMQMKLHKQTQTEIVIWCVRSALAMHDAPRITK